MIRATIQSVLDEPFNSADKIYNTLQNYASQLERYRDRDASSGFITGRTGGLRFDARPDRIEAGREAEAGVARGREEGTAASVQPVAKPKTEQDIPAIAGALREIGNSVKDFAEFSARAIKELGEWITGHLQAAWEGIKSAASGVHNALEDALRKSMGIREGASTERGAVDVRKSKTQRKFRIAPGLFEHDATDATLLDGNVLKSIGEEAMTPDERLAAHLMNETAWRHLPQADGEAYRALVSNFVASCDPEGPVVLRKKTADMIPKLREWQRLSSEAFFEFTAGRPEGRFLKDNPAFATDTYRHNPSKVREAIKTKAQADTAQSSAAATTQAQRESSDQAKRSEELSKINRLRDDMNTPEFLKLLLAKNPASDPLLVTGKLRDLLGKALIDKGGKTLEEALFINPDALTNSELTAWRMSLDAAWQDQEFKDAGSFIEKSKADFEIQSREVDTFAGQFREIYGKLKQTFSNYLTDVFQWAEQTSIVPKIQEFMKLPYQRYLDSRVNFLNAKRDFRSFLREQVRKHGGSTGFSNESLTRMIVVSGLRQHATSSNLKTPDGWFKTNYDKRKAAIKNMRENPWSTLSRENAGELDKMIDDMVGPIVPGSPGSHAAFVERAEQILPDNEKSFLNEAVGYFSNIKDAAKATKQFYWGEDFESFEYYLPDVTYLTHYDLSGKNIMDVKDGANPHDLADWVARPAESIKGGLNATHRAKTGQQGPLKERSQELPHNVVYSNNIVDALLHGGEDLLFDIHTAGARAFGAAFLKHPKMDEIFVDVSGEKNLNLREEMGARFKRMITSDLVEGQLLGTWEKILQPFVYKVQSVALSGFHQVLSQPLSVWGYISSTTPKDAMQFGNALRAIYTAKTNPDSKVGQVVRGIFNQLRGTIDERRPEGMNEFMSGREVDLVQGRIGKWATAAAEKLSFDKEAIRTGFAYGKKVDQGLERAIGAPIRFGDSLGFDAGLVFYYWQRQKKRLGSTNNFSIADLDPEYIHRGDALGAVQDIERAANVTARGFKGRYFQNFEPGVRGWRMLMGAFQGHATHMAVEFQNGISHMNTMWRQWKDGHLQLQGRKLETVADLRSHPTWQLAERQVLGSVGQAVVFSGAAFAVKALMANAMLGVLGEVDEDELALLYAQSHAARARGDTRGAESFLAKARSLGAKAKATTAISRSQQSGDALVANMGRNVFQSAFILPAFASPIGNIALNLGWDKWAEENHNESMEAVRQRNKADTKIARERNDWRALGKLDVERKRLAAQYYLPMGVVGAKDVEIGGSYGILAEGAYDQAKLAFTDKWTPQDWLLTLSAFGYGQADMTKFLRAWKKVNSGEAEAEETNERVEERMDRRLNPIRPNTTSEPALMGARQQ